LAFCLPTMYVYCIENTTVVFLYRIHTGVVG
jgi:hypothetical protein